MAEKVVAKKNQGSESEDEPAQPPNTSPFNAACPAPPVDAGSTPAAVTGGKRGAKKKDVVQLKAEKAKANTESLASMAPLTGTSSKKLTKCLFFNHSEHFSEIASLLSLGISCTPAYYATHQWL